MASEKGRMKGQLPSFCAYSILVLACGLAHADEAPQATAKMECEPAQEPGRVKCSIELRSTGDHTLAWADVAIVELPEFTTALKGRIGPSDATVRDAKTQKWAFGIIAKKTGRGEAKVKVRAVVCDQPKGDAGSPRCVPTTLDVKAPIVVGT